MTRSHAHRGPAAGIALAALAALALAGCGSADAPETPATAGAPAPASAGASPTTAADPVGASPTARAGRDDPATGIAGTRTAGLCQWVTGEEVGTLAKSPVTGPLSGTISTNDTPDGTGTIRRCMTPIGSGVGLIIGTITFDSRADLEKWLGEPGSGITPVPDLPQPATFGVYNTPTGVSQSIQVADGTTLRYITRPGQGDPLAKVVAGKNVPATDHRPALRALYGRLFG